MNQKLKSTLLALALTGVVAVPLAGYAFAQSAPAQAQSQSDNDVETNDDQASAVKGSIQLPAEQSGVEVPDAQEEAQYASLARITPEQAKQAAQSAVPGSVTSVTLGDEDGSLVYEVHSGNTEVLVDAGNGKVLHQEAADSGPETSEQGESSD